MGIKTILMKRDGMSESEAEQQIKDCKEELNGILEAGDPYNEAEDICAEWFGLEPDYIMELLDV